jgi:hypothetical protein
MGGNWAAERERECPIGTGGEGTDTVEVFRDRGTLESRQCEGSTLQGRSESWVEAMSGQMVA